MTLATRFVARPLSTSLRPSAPGGMGEVYRATDTKLQRDVALKVLSRPIGARRRSAWPRFEREARAVAALNHPQHRHHLLGRGSGRRPVSDDGTGRRAAARRADPGAAGCRSTRSADRQRDQPTRSRPRTQQGHHPSRSEAGQRDGHAGRARQGARLRPGQAVADESPGRRHRWRRRSRRARAW